MPHTYKKILIYALLLSSVSATSVFADATFPCPDVASFDKNPTIDPSMGTIAFTAPLTQNMPQSLGGWKTLVGPFYTSSSPPTSISGTLTSIQSNLTSGVTCTYMIYINNMRVGNLTLIPKDVDSSLRYPFQVNDNTNITANSK